MQSHYVICQMNQLKLKPLTVVKMDTLYGRHLSSKHTPCCQNYCEETHICVIHATLVAVTVLHVNDTRRERLICPRSSPRHSPISRLNTGELQKPKRRELSVEVYLSSLVITGEDLTCTLHVSA